MIIVLPLGKQKDFMALSPFSMQDHITITTLGLEFAMAVALGTGAGFWIDRKLGTTPWAMIGGLLLGFALAMYIVIKEANRLKKEENSAKDKK